MSSSRKKRCEGDVVSQKRQAGAFTSGARGDGSRAAACATYAAPADEPAATSGVASDGDDGESLGAISFS